MKVFLNSEQLCFIRSPTFYFLFIFISINAVSAYSPKGFNELRGIRLWLCYKWQDSSSDFFDGLFYIFQASVTQLWIPETNLFLKEIHWISFPSLFFFSFNNLIDFLFISLLILQLREENKLLKSSVMVTAGANQVTIMKHIIKCLFIFYYLTLLENSKCRHL